MAADLVHGMDMMAGGDDECSGGGGGATDIRLVGGEWDSFDSLKSRIMVAGAGGGKSWTFSAGYAGGLNGYSYFSGVSSGGTQTSGYKFGRGEDGSGVGDSDGVAGGGSGYYGGETSNTKAKSAGAGGSSFISGCDGCNAILQASTSENIQHSGKSQHYSGYKFTNCIILGGNEQMPNIYGENENGHTGNGLARITFISE